MPSYEYRIMINGECVYRCYSQGAASMYEFNLDMEGVDYETVKIPLF